MFDILRPPITRSAAIVVLAALFSAAWLLADDTVTLRPSRPDAPAPALDDGRVISQSFVAPIDGLEAISLRLATYRREVDGSVRIELRGPSDVEADRAEGDDFDALDHVDPASAPLVAEWAVPGPSIEDTLWRWLALPAPAVGIAGRRLLISLAADVAGGNAPTVMRSEGDVYPEGAMLVDGEPFDGDIDLLLEFRPGRVGRAAYVLGRTGYPAPAALLLVVGLVASALGFLYRSALPIDVPERTVGSIVRRQGRRVEARADRPNRAGDPQELV